MNRSDLPVPVECFVTTQVSVQRDLASRSTPVRPWLGDMVASVGVPAVWAWVSVAASSQRPSVRRRRRRSVTPR
jgi:hypothetical protein